MWEKGLLAIIGLSGGVAVAGGLFAFLTVVGVVTRLAAGTKTAKNCMLYEDISVLGLLLGNVMDLYGVGLPLGRAGMLFYGMGAGVFTGCLAAALAEVVNVIPVLSKRVRMKQGMSVLILMFAAGKLIGTLIQLVL